VPLIEEGKMESAEMTALLEEYLKPMVTANVDYLVLGCTHYPYLIPQIKKIIPDHIQIIDSGQAVAKQTLNVLKKNNLLNISDENKKQIFYTNSDSKVLRDILGFSENVVEKDF
jgi:glutamate racemase